MPPTHHAVENPFPVPGDVTLKLSTEATQHFEKARGLFVAIQVEHQPPFAALANLLAALCWELRYLRVNLVGIGTLHQQMAAQSHAQIKDLERAVHDVANAVQNSAPKTGEG